MPDLDEFYTWRTWRDIILRAVATGYQSFAAIVLAGFASDEVDELSLWLKAAAGFGAGVISAGQRVAQRILAVTDRR